MAKELYINQTLNECRAVLVENGEILNFLLERKSEKTPDYPNVGNIYKGRVLRVLPGMQSAFVDIGHSKAAFLYVDDAYIPTLEEQRQMVDQDTPPPPLPPAELGPELQSEIIPDEFSTFSDHINLGLRPSVGIETFLKEGDDILVQIAKEPISTKGPRLTRHITIAGRYVVLMPFIEHVGVSRRIENEEERERLKEVLETLRPEGKGIIARTVAEGQDYKTLKTDYQMLLKLWKEISQKSKKANPPQVCHQDLNFVQRILRDITDTDLSRIIIDNKDNLKEAERFSKKFIPSFKGKLNLYQGNIPLFEKFGFELEIERGLSNRIFLRSGGSLNIDQTEALVSIDVNTGKFVGRKTLEETILCANLEAVKEIAYQLRLRNCGGIIVVDFIDMEREEYRSQVYQTLLEALKRDWAKTKILPISGLGLIEMTRKRTRDTLTRTMCTPCPYCEGTGVVKSILTVCYELVRELTKILGQNKGGQEVHVYAHPEVTAQLAESDLDMMETLENQFSQDIIIRSENSYHVEQYEIFPK